MGSILHQAEFLRVTEHPEPSLKSVGVQGAQDLAIFEALWPVNSDAQNLSSTRLHCKGTLQGGKLLPSQSESPPPSISRAALSDNVLGERRGFQNIGEILAADWLLRTEDMKHRSCVKVRGPHVSSSDPNGALPAFVSDGCLAILKWIHRTRCSI